VANYNESINWEELNLDYEGENKFASFFSSQGNIHTYPAKAVPEMVSDLLKKIVSSYKVQAVLDPFVGSGTSALESKYLGLDFWGSDLNPLAVLLAKTKCLTINNTLYVKKHLTSFIKLLKENYKSKVIFPIVHFEGIDFWFKQENTKELSYIKYEINNFLKNSKSNRETYALILLTAFSSTIRRVSLTRNGEFKLYRISPNDIEKFSINAMNEMEDSVKNLLDLLVVANYNYQKDTKSNIYLRNAKNLDYLIDKSIDLVITSPPYGDSKTTVAYGEFSKLSILWMDDLLNKYLKIHITDKNCDQQLLGGNKSKWNLFDDKYFYKSKELKDLISKMDDRINDKQEEIKNLKLLLDSIREEYITKGMISREILESNNLLYQLMREKIRLDIYRKINSRISGLSNKKIKILAKKQTDTFIRELLNEHSRKFLKRQEYLIHELDKIEETLKRNIKTIKKRKSEVIIFLMDLFKVVQETDRVLKSNGIQVWIVGHRTIMGKIVVNMEGILKDWFSDLGYVCEASLERKYSFKRMPHHINSTIERTEEINTMMNEYILVVRKQE
jgi:hypothetical protein